MGCKIVKNKTLIITISVIVIILVSLIGFAGFKMKQVFTNISFEGGNGKSFYVVKNGLGYAFYSKTFGRSELMQCSLETVTPATHKTKGTYELYMHLLNGQDVLKIKTQDNDNLKNVCSNIIKGKPFYYEFKIVK